MGKELHNFHQFPQSFPHSFSHKIGQHLSFRKTIFQKTAWECGFIRLVFPQVYINHVENSVESVENLVETVEKCRV